jgi:hypothetical protein
MNDNHDDRNAIASVNRSGLDARVPPAGFGRSSILAFGLISLFIAAGCASTKLTRNPVATGHLPRPGHIWVYDFAATLADLPADSDLIAHASGDARPQDPEQIAHARKLGALIATELVPLIRAMGMPAAHALAGSTPQLNDIVIRGCLVSFDEGDAKKRMRVGFGSGASEVNAAAEGLQVTGQGLRKLGSGTAAAGGGKAPGAALGVVGLIATHNPAGLIISGASKMRGEKTGSSKVEGRAKQIAQEIADVLEERFKQQGWIY